MSGAPDRGALLQANTASSMRPLLGCIADDFTGATDLANTLTREGMSTVVLLGAPAAERALPEADALVIALKSRSNPPHEAVQMSLTALERLQRAGARQFYFKYCSTFDSTDRGNIGPVAEALLDALGEAFSVACAAFPTNGRTVYQGHLFVGSQLLSDSSMRDHPLTPMTDPSLVRVLARQCTGRVGLVAFETVRQGAAAMRAAFEEHKREGFRFAIVDALTDGDLRAIGEACAGLKLVTGGSGLALGLPENFRRAGLLTRGSAASLPRVGGHAAVLAGSCSAATQRQVARMKSSCASYELDPLAARDARELAERALQWARPRLGARPVLVYSTAQPDRVARVQAKLGRGAAGTLVEESLAHVARELVDLGVRRLIVAGGETSGAVVSALGIEGLRIGSEIDPGVPWTTSVSREPLALALKSGNFGADDFFMKAFTVLEAVQRSTEIVERP